MHEEQRHLSGQTATASAQEGAFGARTDLPELLAQNRERLHGHIFPVTRSHPVADMPIEAPLQARGLSFGSAQLALPVRAAGSR